MCGKILGMDNTITITDQERSSNVAFQIKQLLINLQTQVKPQLINAITLMETGVEGVSKEDVNSALGDNSSTILEKVKTIANAI